MPRAGRRPHPHESLAIKFPFVRTLVFDSRILTIFLIQFISNLLLPAHNADAFKSVPLNKSKRSVSDSVTEILFGGFRRWDAVHFIHIAQYGYTFENNLAFLPLYPIFVQLTTKVWYNFFPANALHAQSALLLSGTGINLICFTAAGYVLFLLTGRLFNNPSLSYLSVTLYALNPASVFFSSCYSESLYSFLSWLGLLCLYNTRSTLVSRITEASVCFSLAFLTRSNGLLNCGFIAYVLLASLLKESRCQNSKKFQIFMKTLAVGVMAAAIIVLPYVYHQFGIYKQFCKPVVPFIPYSVQAIAAENHYVLPGQLDKLKWCNNTIPFSYSAIQTKYWGVGFLGYFQLRKLPCFFLALPAIFLSGAASLRFLAALKPSKNSLMEILGDHSSLLPYSIHLMFMCVLGAFFMNVEVITRMIFSASPLLYWYAALLLKESMGNVEIPIRVMTSLRLWSAYKTLWSICGDWRAKLLIVYFLSYAVLGTSLHSLFLPWT